MFPHSYFRIEGSRQNLTKAYTINASPRLTRDRKTHIMRESSLLTRKAVVKHL